MTQPQDTRRRPDGSIDFDFYRARALALRRQAIRDAFKRKAAIRFMLITVAAVMSAPVWVPARLSQLN